MRIALFISTKVVALARPVNMPNQELSASGHITVRAEPTGLSKARQRICNLARKLSLSEEQIIDIHIAVGEAISNAYLHGTPDRGNNTIHLDWHVSDDALTIAVRDEGLGFASGSPTASAKSTAARGWGIKLMRASMDEVRFGFDRGAKVTLRKRLRAQSLWNK